MHSLWGQTRHALGWVAPWGRGVGRVAGHAAGGWIGHHGLRVIHGVEGVGVGGGGHAWVLFTVGC